MLVNEISGGTMIKNGDKFIFFGGYVGSNPSITTQSSMALDIFE